MKIFVGIPWLRDGDAYESYIESCLSHLRGQRCPVKTMPPYVTPPLIDALRDGDHAHHQRGHTKKMNEIVDKFLKTDATHLALVDADLEWPPDALYTLFKMDVDVASGMYSFHNDRFCMMAGVMLESETHRFKPRKVGYLRGRIIGENEFVAAGTGCILLKRRVFEQQPPLRFISKEGMACDTYFWWMAQKRGFKCRVNGNVICGHLPKYPLAEITRGVDLSKENWWSLHADIL